MDCNVDLFQSFAGFSVEMSWNPAEALESLHRPHRLHLRFSSFFLNIVLSDSTHHPHNLAAFYFSSLGALRKKPASRIFEHFHRGSTHQDAWSSFFFLCLVFRFSRLHLFCYFSLGKWYHSEELIGIDFILGLEFHIFSSCYMTWS